MRRFLIFTKHAVTKLALYTRACKRIWEETVGTHHYLISDTGKVYRVPTHITPDLICMYREARNANIDQDEMFRSIGASGFLASIMDTDKIMESLGFSVYVQTKRIDIEV